MSDHDPTLDDAGLYLPADFFHDSDLDHHHRPRPFPAAVDDVPVLRRRLHLDDLAYLRASAAQAQLARQLADAELDRQLAEAELARQLAAALTLRRRAAAKARREPHSLFEFGPDVLSSAAPAPAPLYSRGVGGDGYCRGCLGSLDRVEHVQAEEPLYRLQLPARPRCSKTEDCGFPAAVLATSRARARARAQAQAAAATGHSGWSGSRPQYGGTGVFLPRVAGDDDEKRKTGLQGDTREKQLQLQLAQQYPPLQRGGLALGKQAMSNQHLPKEPWACPRTGVTDPPFPFTHPLASFVLSLAFSAGNSHTPIA